MNTEPIQSRKQYPSNDRNGEPIFEGDFVKGVGKHVGQSEVFFDAGQWQPFSYLNDFDGNNYELVKPKPIQSVDEAAKEFLKTFTDGAYSVRYVLYKDLFKAGASWQAKQQQIVPDEKILCAAIWYKDGIKYDYQPKNIDSGYVMCGRRHNNIISLNAKLTGNPTRRETSTQGFMTSLDRFVGRVEAGQIAQKAGQIKECVMVGMADSKYVKPQNEELISEELY